MAGRPASRLAMNAHAVRDAALSVPISRAIRASMYSECRAPPCWTCTPRFPTHDDLTPVGIVPCDRARSISTTPVVCCSGGAMIVNQISFAIVMLTNDGCLGP
eukprot:8434760-Pyramimonas_sp.AAC.1